MIKYTSIPMNESILNVNENTVYGTLHTMTVMMQDSARLLKELLLYFNENFSTFVPYRTKQIILKFNLHT